MTLIDTLEYFIDDTRARLSDIEWEIREETNYIDDGHMEPIEKFCDEYDENDLYEDNDPNDDVVENLITGGD